MAYLRMYNEYEAETEAGRCFSSEVEEALRPIIDEYFNNGFDGRDMQSVVMATVTGIMAHLVLKRAVSLHKIHRALKKQEE